MENKPRGLASFNKTPETPLTMSETMPAWVHQGTRPTTDSTYLSNLTRYIFQAGARLHVLL